MKGSVSLIQQEDTNLSSKNLPQKCFPLYGNCEIHIFPEHDLKIHDLAIMLLNKNYKDVYHIYVPHCSGTKGPP